MSKIYTTDSKKLQNSLEYNLGKKATHKLANGHLLLWRCPKCKCIGIGDLEGDLNGWTQCEDCTRVFCGDCLSISRINCETCNSKKK